MASFDQKLRTLYLMEILLERTDDEHMLNASELCTILDQEYGISTDRRTIYTEMEILDKFGLDIQQKKGKCPGYYIGVREFELPELKLLVDAVQSSKFITEKKSKELIQKLEKLCCKSDADMLSKYVFIVNRPKTENETVYYNVDYIHRVPVSVSTQFFGWLTGIGSGMRIVGPEDVKQQYKEYLQSVLRNY
mgnify:FL=1